MSWFLRGVQSAVFHYASCAPCTGYTDGRKRRKAARAAQKVKDKLQLENPDAYHHPPPTGTNPFWDEEIRMGPGPPPRRARRTNTGSTRAITTAGTQSSALSKGGSSVDGGHAHGLRLSDDMLDDETWNHKRYQREDEDLWGIDEPPIPIQHLPSGSSSGGTGYTSRRPGTGRSSSYYSVRAPPVNDLHPPVVSLPSPDPADNRWMLQPPPKANVMAGRERASNRSRSGSGASSRVELSLQRQLSTRAVMQRLDRGETPDMPSMSPNSSYTNVNVTRRSSGASSDNANKHRPAPPHSDLKVIRVRQSRPALSRPALSTVVSSDDPNPNENTFPRRDFTIQTTTSTDSYPYLMKHRAPLSSSDVSSLNCLQDLVSPRDLLKSRFVSAPLVEAKIRLPEEDADETRTLSWGGSGFGISRGWGEEQRDGARRVPFDSLAAGRRDPRLRWSVDF